jgi:catechol 2,3-dioxygenase-like lactoylglutathione lyase family enzyme
VPQAFTHGTLKCDDVERSRRFYVAVLGLEIAAGFNMAQYIKHPASPWYIVALQRSPRQYLASVNRFTLQIGSAAEVELAHQEFKTNRSQLDITEVGTIESNNGKASCIFSDLDKNWWELTN